jgi:hypothetical protein
VPEVAREVRWSAPLHECDPALRALFTGYLAVVGLGLMMSFAQILFTHGCASSILHTAANLLNFFVQCG